MCKVKCSECGKVFSISIQTTDIDFECIESNERNMGPENHYEGKYYFKCPSCGQPGALVIDCWEYPVGTFNYCETHIEEGNFKVVECECNQICGDFISSQFNMPEDEL